MPKKRLVVVIHGSKTPESHVPLLRILFAHFYRYFGIEVGPDLWLEPLRGILASAGDEVLLFNWKGGISWFSARKAADDLRQLLRAKRDMDIVLFGQSLGGVIAERVARDASLPIRRIVTVVTPHSRLMKRLPPQVEHINLFSHADNYLRFAGHVLYMGTGAVEVSGARNISLPNLRHSDFTSNLEVAVDYKKRRLFEYYRELVA